MTTFVTVGNATQPFHRLLNEVMRLADQLPRPVIVQHGRTPFAKEGCLAIPFLDSTQFVDYMQRASVLIMHAGAGSIIHALQAGKRPVVMPRRRDRGEVVDEHQVELAEVLSAAGKIILVSEPGELSKAVSRAQEFQAESRILKSSPLMVGFVAQAIERIAYRNRR